jgi:hypothetical protein
MLKKTQHLLVIGLFLLSCKKSYYLDNNNNFIIKAGRKYTVHKLLPNYSSPFDWNNDTTTYLLRADSIVPGFLNLNFYGLQRLYYLDNAIIMRKKGNFWKINQCITDVFLDSLNFNELYKNRFKSNFNKNFDLNKSYNLDCNSCCEKPFYCAKSNIVLGKGNYIYYGFLGYRTKKEARKYRRILIKRKKINIEGNKYYCEYSCSIYPNQKIYENLTNGKDSIPGQRILKIELYENKNSIFPVLQVEIGLMPTFIEEKREYFYELYIMLYYNCLPVKFDRKNKDALKLIPKINEPSINNNYSFEVKSIKFKNIVDSLVLNDLSKIDSINKFTFKPNGLKKDNYYGQLYNSGGFYNRSQILEIVREIGLFDTLFPNELRIIF